MTENAPLQLHESVVLPEWIDYNGHMNVAFYVLHTNGPTSLR